MYKEFREMSRTDAVESLYQDMAARHRARFSSIHVCQHLANRILKSTRNANKSTRSSKLSRFTTKTSFAALTSNNSSPRTSNSLFLTVSPSPRARKSSPPADHPHSHKWFAWRGFLFLWWRVQKREWSLIMTAFYVTAGYIFGHT